MAWSPFADTLSSPLQLTLLGVLVAIGSGFVTTERGLRATPPTDPRHASIVRWVRWIAAPLLLFAAVIAITAIVAGELVRWELVAIVVGAASGIAGVAVALWPWDHGTGRTRTAAGAVIAAGCVVLAVFAATASTAEPPLGITFTVYGTCLSGACGLIQRDGPGRQYSEVGSRYDDGAEISIVCRTRGEPPDGQRWPWWIKLENGHFVSDAFVDRPKDGGPPKVPICRADELP